MDRRFFWQNGAGGLLNHSDFWETIAPNVHVYLSDIGEVKEKCIRLTTGEDVEADILVCGTGWHPAAFDFFEPEERRRLGLPHPLTDDVPEEADLWKHLHQQADAEITKDFPMMTKPPDHFHKRASLTPYRLYNGILPLRDDSIAFVGYTIYANYFRGTECQAIYVTAIFDKNIKLPPLETRQAQVAKAIAFCQRRYLSAGNLGNFIPFESNWYTDKLLQDVGLNSHLKGWWWSKWFVPGVARDLAGSKDEYIAKYGQKASDT